MNSIVQLLSIKKWNSSNICVLYFLYTCFQNYFNFLVCSVLGEHCFRRGDFMQENVDLQYKNINILIIVFFVYNLHQEKQYILYI
jgi:hypothetical protein